MRDVTEATEAGKSVLNAFHIFGPISRLTQKPATACSVESDQLLRIDAAEREKLITVSLGILPVSSCCLFSTCSECNGTRKVLCSQNTVLMVGSMTHAGVLPPLTHRQQRPSYVCLQVCSYGLYQGVVPCGVRACVHGGLESGSG